MRAARRPKMMESTRFQSSRADTDLGVAPLKPQSETEYYTRRNARRLAPPFFFFFSFFRFSCLQNALRPVRPRHRPAGGGAPRGAPAAMRFAITKIEKKKKEKEGRMLTTLETRPGGNRRPNQNRNGCYALEFNEDRRPRTAGRTG